MLARAVLNAANRLGLSLDQLVLILDIEKYSMDQQYMKLDTDSKPGKKALLLIQIFQSLDALHSGDIEWIQHFMCSQNQITGGVPMEQIQSEIGLVKVQECLQALLIK